MLSGRLPSVVVPGINVNVSDESHRGWAGLAKKLGVSQQVMFDVLGRHIADGTLDLDVPDEIAQEARDLTHERRRAGGPRKKKPG